MFSTSEFSRITGLSIKALRLYHEKGLLIPHTVEEATGYRFYSQQNVEKARVICELKAMEFSLQQIQEILDQYSDEAETVDALENQKQVLRNKIENYERIVVTLNNIISTEKEAKEILKLQPYEIEEKSVDEQLVATVRFTGKYGDCSQAFAKLGRSLGWLICGKALSLYYDAEYKEDGADIESCMPVRKKKEAEGIEFKTLPGGKCISLIHRGSYPSIGRSYERMLAYANQLKIQPTIPTREIYLKGPGMLFKGNPKKYLTEIQFMIG